MKRISIILLAAVALVGCIKNDLPKPTVDLYIASLEVEGTNGDIVIDRSTYTATIPLAEETNIEAVQFKSITYASDVITNINFKADDEKIVVSKDLNNAIVNMTNTEYIYLTYFQTYEWKIVATQQIDRVWTVNGQIGATEWDLDNHRVKVKRRQDYPLSDVQTLDVRFGPRSAYDFPEPSEMPTNFDNAEKMRTVSVAAHGKNVVWELFIEPTLAEPEFCQIIGGANVAWIKANAIDGSEIVFEYRKAGSEEWIAAKPEWYATDANNPYNRYEAGFVKAVLRGLDENSTYEIRGWANTSLADGTTSSLKTEVFTFETTSADYQMPNSQMEQWGKFTNDQNKLPSGEAGPCWYPFSSVTEMFWATGNPGGTSLGEKYNLTYPAYKSENAENVPSDSTGEVSAFMGSQFVLGLKFAAGNLFVGRYGATLGTNAKVYFGREIEQNTKPVAVRFKIKYARGGINYVNSKSASVGTDYFVGNKQIPVKGGQPDLAKIFFCLTDWSEAHCVYSADETTFFDPRTAEGILALGYFDSDNNPELVVENTQEWHTMTIPVEYKDATAVPSMLVMTCTCSGYGDYFTGSSESWMYVDDFELLYDLDDSNQPK